MSWCQWTGATTECWIWTSSRTPVDDGSLSIEQATDALRRWQRFLDRYLHAQRAPAAGWTDFPPTAILPLLEIPPFVNPIRWND
jgi:hypothetical protein